MLSWTPQNDLLADDRLTAFITHSGMASTMETALRGKPGVSCFHSMQYWTYQVSSFLWWAINFEMPEWWRKNGLGKFFDKRNLYDENKFYEAVKDLLENERYSSQRYTINWIVLFSYRENAKRMAAMMKKKPFSAKETMIKWVIVPFPLSTFILSDTSNSLMNSVHLLLFVLLLTIWHGSPIIMLISY